MMPPLLARQLAPPRAINTTMTAQHVFASSGVKLTTKLSLCLFPTSQVIRFWRNSLNSAKENSERADNHKERKYQLWNPYRCGKYSLFGVGELARSWTLPISIEVIMNITAKGKDTNDILQTFR